MRTTNYNIILASNSPRRKELLAGLGMPFEVRVLKDIDESYPTSLQGGDIPYYISRAKAEAYRESLADNELLITADTIVWLNGQVLGKPASNDEARSMLTMLSGNTHQVYTGVTLTTVDKQISFDCCSDVTFAKLTPEEINYYVEHFHPLDKAGAYGIQEWIGYVGVESITGSFFNVMGLPIQRVYKALQQHFNVQL